MAELSDETSASGARRYALGLLAVAVASAFAAVLRPFAGLENVDLVFLIAVLWAAVRFGLGPSLAAAAASILSYNFLFLPPLYSFEIADPRNVAALAVFAMVATVASNLAGRVRAQAVAANRQARVTDALYAFSRRIAGIMDEGELVAAATERVSALLSRDVLMLLPDECGVLQVAASSSSEDVLDDLELEALRALWAAGERDGIDVRRIGPRLIYPLRASGGVAALVALSREGLREPLAPNEDRLFGALCDQLSGALERIALGRERDTARLAAEGERLRTALLSSLSHDLKTPLTSITGAVTALRQYPELYDSAARDELTATIQGEAERLGRFVTNLLDMSRLEAGSLSPAMEAVDLGEAVGAALKRTETLLGEHRVNLDLETGLPMLFLDPVLFEQVLVNLLDNAAKYSPPRSTVTVTCGRDRDGVAVAVLDEGPGLTADDLERVFDKFYRARSGDRQRAGTGLGLAICWGFVRAMGGSIRAANRRDRTGAVFSVAFPPEAFVSLPDQAHAA